MSLFLNFHLQIKKSSFVLNDNYLNIQKSLNITFCSKIKKPIKIGILALGLKNGGRARITSLLIKYLNKIKIFNILLFTIKIKENDEYKKPENSERILLKKYKINNLIKEIKKKRVNILIYQLSNSKEINILNKLKHLKVIFYLHQSIFYWLYSNYSIFKSLYKAYQNSKYIIDLIPVENYYLFKKWGINSLLMNNFITFEYNSTLTSSLASKVILMVGRGADKYKRFQLGILAMEYISKEIDESEMIIISDLNINYFTRNNTYI